MVFPYRLLGSPDRETHLLSSQTLRWVRWDPQATCLTRCPLVSHTLTLFKWPYVEIVTSREYVERKGVGDTQNLVFYCMCTHVNILCFDALSCMFCAENLKRITFRNVQVEYKLRLLIWHIMVLWFYGLDAAPDLTYVLWLCNSGSG